MASYRPEDYFSADFIEYMHRELNWSSLPEFRNEDLRWVFWARTNDDPDFNFVGLLHNVSTSQKVRESIRYALRKMILHEFFVKCLVQFWAATTTSEGRILLTTHNKPFALGLILDSPSRQWLCEYRLKLREYKFYGDEESGEEQLGLPGRVFLHKLPESAPSVDYYTEKEYPQRDDAISCGIDDSWALPVFEHSSHTCVGVLEIVCIGTDLFDPPDWHSKSFLGKMSDIFQEFGLQCFDGYHNCESKSWEKDREKKGCTSAFQELKTVLRSVCEIQMLPLALTWVPCSACNDLMRGQHLSKGVELCVCKYFDLADYFAPKDSVFSVIIENKYSGISQYSQIRKGRVSGRALSSPNMLVYCSDITQLSIDEYPLVPFTRTCKFRGWFTICLQSGYPENEVYVLEFFLPVRIKDNENIWTTLSLILGTMRENLKTFKLGSGQELGEVSSVEVMDFQNGQQIHSIQMIQATLKDAGLILQPVQLDQPLTNAINNAISVVSEEQIYILANSEPLQNGETTTQQESYDRPSMDPLNKGENIVAMVTSSEEGKRKTQEREHKKPGVRIDLSFEDILKCAEMKRKHAAKELKVSISTLKRVCRDNGVHRWPPRNIEKVRPIRPSPLENEGQISQLNHGLSFNQALTGVAQIKPGFQDANRVIFKAKYENHTIRFRLSLLSKFAELQQEVAKRLNLEAGTYYVKYKDEENELIIMACDEDLQHCMSISGSLDSTSIVVLLEPKQPIINLNPAK